MDKYFHIRMDTEEEKRGKNACAIVPMFALYTFAELACKSAKELCNAITDPRNPKNAIRPIDIYEDQKVINICGRIRDGVNKSYDAYIDYLSTLQEYHDMDVYESLALSNEEANRINLPYIESVTKAIDNSLSSVRPLDPYVFSATNRLLFLSSLFVKYRSFIREQLDKSYVYAFRSLNIDRDVRRLANAMKMKDRDGKTILYMYTEADVSLWASLQHRRQYHGIEIAKTHFLDIRRMFKTDEIDRCQYELIRSMFSFENIDRICAAGNGGRTYEFSRYLNSKNFIGCMNTYEQYSIMSNLLIGDIRSAYKRMTEVREKYEGDFIVCYKDENGRAFFDGMYLTYEEASAENGVPVSALKNCVEKNEVFGPGRQVLHRVKKNLAFFRMKLLEDYLLTIINKKAS